MAGTKQTIQRISGMTLPIGNNPYARARAKTTSLRSGLLWYTLTAWMSVRWISPYRQLYTLHYFEFQNLRSFACLWRGDWFDVGLHVFLCTSLKSACRLECVSFGTTIWLWIWHVLTYLDQIHPKRASSQPVVGSRLDDFAHLFVCVTIECFCHHHKHPTKWLFASNPLCRLHPDAGQYGWIA